MEPLQFCYWLKGFFELQNPDALSEEQTAEVKRHLAMVFNREPYRFTATLQHSEPNKNGDIFPVSYVAAKDGSPGLRLPDYAQQSQERIEVVWPEGPPASC